MIRSYVFSEGRVVGEDLDIDALKLVRADKGLHIWVDLLEPTPEESKLILEELFNFHPLAIEDCVTVSQLPKVEDYEDYLFLVIHAVDFSRKDKFQTKEIDFFLGKEFLVTYHVTPMRSIQAAQERLHKGTFASFKQMDRLLHLLLDALVDNYQPVLTELSEELQELEDAVFTVGPSSSTLIGDFRQIKSEVALLRQIIRPQREVIYRVSRGEFKIIRSILLPYYRDIHDNLTRIDETAHGFNDQMFLSMDVYLNKSANETNDVIKLLTLLTAITTPTILVGTWYGMNFHDMPELSYPHGYLIAGVVTLVSTVGLMVWLRWKRWM
jgi:magnesium transporter